MKRCAEKKALKSKEITRVQTKDRNEKTGEIEWPQPETWVPFVIGHEKRNARGIGPVNV